MNEPVAWWDGKEPSVLGLSYFKNDYCPIPLYTHPADLTDEAIDSIWTEMSEQCDEEFIDMKQFARAILRKAQEK